MTDKGSYTENMLTGAFIFSTIPVFANKLRYLPTFRSMNTLSLYFY